MNLNELKVAALNLNIDDLFTRNKPSIFDKDYLQRLERRRQSWVRKKLKEK